MCTTSNATSTTLTVSDTSPYEATRGRLLAQVYAAALAIALKAQPGDLMQHESNAHFAAMKAMELATMK